MKTVYHQPVGFVRPKRGDLLQSAIGTKRERTWLVLSAHVLPTRFSDPPGYEAQRTRITAARWWEIDPPLRMALYRSAERNGGQNLHPFYRFPAKRKARSFEDYMRGAA